MLLFIKQNLWLPVISALFLLIAVATPDPLVSTAFLFCLFIVWGCALADYVYNFSEHKTTKLPMKAIILDYDLIYDLKYYNLQVEVQTGKRIIVTVSIDSRDGQVYFEETDNHALWFDMTEEERTAVMEKVFEHFED